MWSKKKIFSAIAIFFTVKAILATIIIVFSGVNFNEQIADLKVIDVAGRQLLQGNNNQTDCGNGDLVENVRTGAQSCNCHSGFMDDGKKKCSYKGKSKLTAFLISFFVGSFGADWFYLANGDAGYIVAGVFKLLTFGCCGIWALVDWIRILANGFPDGSGMPLYNDM